MNSGGGNYCYVLQLRVQFSGKFRMFSGTAILNYLITSTPSSENYDILALWFIKTKKFSNREGKSYYTIQVRYCFLKQ